MFLFFIFHMRGKIMHVSGSIHIFCPFSTSKSLLCPKKQGSEWVSTVCMMTKRQCWRLGEGALYGKCGHWAEISLYHQLPRQPCRGVSPDKEQEVRGNSRHSLTDNMNVPRNTGNQRYGNNLGKDKIPKFTLVSVFSLGFRDVCNKVRLHYRGWITLIL